LLKGRTGRLARIAVRISPKLKEANFSHQGVREQVQVMQRMFRAYTSGRYTMVPWKAMASVAAAFVYFINPFDLVPDFVLVAGFVDDATVLLWVYGLVRHEVDKFLEWERRHSLPYNTANS